MQSTTCTVEGCGNGGEIVKGMCRKHYSRVRRYGSIEGRTKTVAGRNRCKPDLTLKERIEHIGYTLTPSGCWEWKGHRHDAGYPMINWKRERTYIHRVVLEMKLGHKLGPGIYACHRCDNPPCMNPDHLFPGTIQDNIADMWRKGRGWTGGGPGGAAKYPKETIDKVFALKEQGTATKDIAEAAGISLSYTYGLLSGRSARPTNYR